MCVESTNKPVFVNLQWTLLYGILFLLKSFKRNWWDNDFSLLLFIVKFFNLMNLNRFVFYSEWKFRSLWINKSFVLPWVSSLKVEFHILENEPVRYSLTLLELWSWPKDTIWVMLEWAVLLKAQTSLYLWFWNGHWIFGHHLYW